MRFKLNENRIDDLKRMIARDMETADITSNIRQIFNKYNILSIDLLSEKDVEVILKINKRLLQYDSYQHGTGDWWLSTPSKIKNNIMLVHGSAVSYDESYQKGEPIDRKNLVRPALSFKYNCLQPLKKYIFFNQLWIAISENKLLYCGNKYILHTFDKNTNNYEFSDIKMYLQRDFLHDIIDNDNSANYDQLNEYVHNDIDNKEFSSISLPSVEEVNKLKDDGMLRKVDNTFNGGFWWLRDGGYNQDYYKRDSKEGYKAMLGSAYGSFASDVDRRNYLKPVIYLNTNRLNKYQEYWFYDQPWLAISNNALIYMGKLKVGTEYDYQSNNNCEYEYSIAKKCVENDWLNRITSSY